MKKTKNCGKRALCHFIAFIDGAFSMALFNFKEFCYFILFQLSFIQIWFQQKLNQTVNNYAEVRNKTIIYFEGNTYGEQNIKNKLFSLGVSRLLGRNSTPR